MIATPPIARVMLIDDSAADNFLHKVVLQKSGQVGDIVAYQMATDALVHLGNPSEDLPELILLDLNMPKMNGFEFLSAYQRQLDRARGRPIVVMLSTSQDDTDLSRAESHELVSRFLNKPLTSDVIAEIVREHF